MESLATVSKILYDKDYLDKVNLIRQKYDFKKVLYETDEFDTYRSVFIKNISEYNYMERYTNDLEDTVKIYIKDELNKLTQNKCHEWCKYTVHMIMVSLKQLFYVYDMIESIQDRGMLNNAYVYNKKLFNRLSKELILNMVLNHYHKNEIGLIDQVVQFQCDICKNYTNKLLHPEFCWKPRCPDCISNKPVDMIDELKKFLLSDNQTDEQIKRELDNLCLSHINLKFIKN